MGHGGLEVSEPYRAVSRDPCDYLILRNTPSDDSGRLYHARDLPSLVNRYPASTFSSQTPRFFSFNPKKLIIQKLGHVSVPLLLNAARETHTRSRHQQHFYIFRPIASTRAQSNLPQLFLFLFAARVDTS